MSYNLYKVTGLSNESGGNAYFDPVYTIATDKADALHLFLQRISVLKEASNLDMEFLDKIEIEFIEDQPLISNKALEGIIQDKSN